MSDSFDAYHKWLGIPPADQPPDAYRLLGIPKYEQDPDVIESAADRQMAHVKTHAAGPHAQFSQQVLNQLSKARTCLLDAGRKLQYDEHLRQKEAVADLRVEGLTAASSTPGDDTSAAWLNLPVDELHVPIDELPETVSASTPGPAKTERAGKTGQSGLSLGADELNLRPKQTKGLSLRTKVLGHVIAPVIGLLLGYVILCWIAPSTNIFSGSADDPASEVGYAPDDHDEHDAGSTHSDESPQVIPDYREPVTPVVPPPDKAPVPSPDEAPKPADPGEDLVVPDEEPVEPERPQVVRRPFAELAAHVDLPSVGNRKPISLGTIHVPPEETLQLKLWAAPLVDAPDAKFTMVDVGDPKDETAMQAWIVSLVNGAEKLAIARFFFEDQSLKFQWSSHATSVPATQLRNSLVEASLGDKKHALALRTPQELPPLVLQMEETVSRVSFKLPDCPPIERLYINLRPASRLGPVRDTNDAETTLVKLGDRIELQYSAATLTVRLADRRGELAIEVEGKYTVGGREFPFATERLKKHALGSQKALEDCLAEGRRGEAEAYQLNAQITSLARRSFSNTPSGIIARRNRDQQLASLRGQAARNSKKVAKLRERVPELQATLREMPDVIALTNALRNGCKIHYRVALMLDYHEIDLAVSSDDVQDVLASDTPTVVSPGASPVSPRVKAAMETLKGSPDDPDANLLVGSYYCLEENDWAKGAPLLARSGDDMLVAVVKMDRAAPTDVDAQVKLGDAWFELSTADRDKRGFLARAAYWYREALPGVTGLRRIRIEKRLENIDEAGDL